MPPAPSNPRSSTLPSSGSSSRLESRLQRRAQPDGHVLELRLGVAGEPEPHPCHRAAVEGEAAAGLEDHAAGQRPRRPAVDVDPVLDADPQGQAAGGEPERDGAAQLAHQRDGERVAPAPVHLDHPVQVALELAVLHELGHGPLQHRIAVAIERGARVPHPRDERPRSVDEAEPEVRAEDLGERAQVDHHSGRVAGRERSQRASVELELGVLVDLHHREPVLLGQRQQPGAPGRREDGQGGVLALRGHQHRPQPARAEDGLELLHLHAIAVHGHGQASRTGPGEGLPGAAPAHGLDRHDVALREEGLGHQEGGHLRPPGHQHVSGRGRDAAPTRQEVRQRLAKARVALRIGRARARPPRHQRPPIGASQGRAREEPGVGHAAGHLEQPAGGRRRRGRRAADQVEAEGGRRWRCRGPGGRPGQVDREPGRDRAALTWSRNHPSLGAELGVGRHDRVAAHPELLG